MKNEYPIDNRINVYNLKAFKKCHKFKISCIEKHCIGVVFSWFELHASGGVCICTCSRRGLTDIGETHKTARFCLGEGKPGFEAIYNVCTNFVLLTRFNRHTISVMDFLDL